MNLLRRALAHAITNLLRNKIITFLSLGIIAFTLLINGLFAYISHSLDRFAAQFTKNLEVIFYLEDQAEQQEIDELIQRMRSSLLIEKVSFHSRTQAEQEFLLQFPDLRYILSEFEKSPFPASIEVSFKPDAEMDTQVTSFIDEMENSTLIESKQVNFDWAKKLISIKKFISAVGYFLSFILIFVSVFIIYNVIKLNIIYRREEITIFRLVGATNFYIRFPFIIEGAMLGFAGSLLACLLLFLTLKLFPAYASFMWDIFKDLLDFKTIPFSIFGNMIWLGTGIGLFSSLFSLNKFMRVERQRQRW